MTAIRVVYGRLADAELKRAGCVRCRGEGSCEPFWNAGRLEPCPRCDGSGDCLSEGFSYRASEPVKRGDVVLVGVKPWDEPYQEIEATVLGSGTTYDGPLRPVIRVIEGA